MDRIATSARGTAGTFGAGEEAQLPARAEQGLPPATASGRASLTWLRHGGRIARNVVVAIALMALVPVVTVTTKGDRLMRFLANDRGARLKAEIAEVSRSLVLPRDPSITPMQAGLAFNALHPPRERQPGISFREPAFRPARTWEGLTLEPGMFPTAAQWGIYAGPGSNAILEAAAKGFTPAEAAYLKTIATAPAWRAFDIVARAPAVDFLGGQYASLGGVAKWEDLPIAHYKTTRTMANAGISRAAWFLSRGQRDSAETALRSIVSFGFALVDNGATPMDQLIGNIVIATGRDGLRRFYGLTGDARAGSAAVATPVVTAAMLAAEKTPENRPPEEIRRGMIARLANPALPRAERIQAMRMLSLSQCTNVREMLMGPRSDVADAIAKARQDLTRFPSERPVIDLASRPRTVELRDLLANPVQLFTVSMAAVAGTAIGNPQVATCAYVATSRYIP